MVNQVAAPGDVVLVTGGSGFVGSHIVSLLVEKGENIAEVRIFDLQPPKEDLISGKGHVRITYVRGDVRDLETLRSACEGVDAIIHTAAVLDTSNDADIKFLHSVNVLGTQNVIQVCKEESIEHLIHTSTTEVHRTFSERHDVTEKDIDISVTFTGDLVFPAYSLTKREGEEHVLAADGTHLKNGKRLMSLSLRPCGVYGERDEKYVTGVLRTGACMKVMPILGSSGAKIDRVYVGNVAWAHVLALNLARTDCGTKGIGGHAYHITDGSSSDNNFTWMKPYMEQHYIKLLPINVPLWLVYYFWLLLEIFVLLLSPVVKVALVANRCELYLACTTATYNGTKARKMLGYTPLYTAKEAFYRSMCYYSKLKF